MNLFTLSKKNNVSLSVYITRHSSRALLPPLLPTPFPPADGDWKGGGGMECVLDWGFEVTWKNYIYLLLKNGALFWITVITLVDVQSVKLRRADP